MDDKGLHPAPATDVYDSEINIRVIVYFVVGLVVVTLVALLLMWGMSAAFRHQEEASDRLPSPIEEEQLDPMPPAPRLQAVPPRDMDELRHDDRQTLTTYGWVDQANGVAHIPVERAIAILAQKGLGSVPSSASSVSPAPMASPTSEPAHPVHPVKPVHPKKGAK